MFLRLVSDPWLPRRRRTAPAAGRRDGRSLAHLRLELALLARNGESLLLTLGIPVLLLVFFANVDVLPIDGEPIDFLAPGVLALAVLSTAFVNLAIGTGFEREYGVLKRLGATPLGRPRLLAAKTLAILVVEVVQVAVLWPLALALGWDPSPEPALRRSPWCSARSAFAGLGLCLAGTLQGARDAGRRQRPLPRAAPALGHGDPARRAARTRRGPSPAPCRAAPSPRWCAARSPRASTVPGRAWAVLAVWAVAGPAPRHPPLPLGVTRQSRVSNTIAIYRDGHERTTRTNHTTEAVGEADPSRAMANDPAEAACAAATCARPS